MATLEEMARKKFSFLSEAEIGVLEAAPDGTVADCRGLGGDEDLQNVDGTPRPPGEQWPETRNVRADLIRWLCVDREAREQVDPRGIQIRGARITEPLDLSFTKVLFPLGMFGCRLDQPLNLQWAKMPVLSLEGGWTGQIFADGLNVEGGLFLRNGFHAEGEVRLVGAAIGGDLNAEGGTFKNSNGYALNADGIKVTGRVFLRNGFSAEGEVRLLGATIGSDLDATGGRFKNSNGYALNADGIKVTGRVFLRNGFSAEGEVRLLGATIGGDLDAAGGRLKNSNGDALSADGIKVHGGVLLRDEFVAEGTVRLLGAEITGQLEVGDAWLDALNLENARITGPFFWSNIHKDFHPDFPDKEWKSYLNLPNAKVGLLIDQEAGWPEKGRLILDGFVYDRIVAGRTDAEAPTDAKVPIDAAARLRWLRLQPDWLGFRPQPYEQLIAVFRQMGHEHQVAKVAIAKQKDLYEHGDLGWWGKRPKLGSVSRCRLRVRTVAGVRLDGDAGPRRNPRILGSSLALGPRYGAVRQGGLQSDEETVRTPLPHYYPQFHAFVYSLDVIFPFDLGQKSHWRLSENQSGALVYWIFEAYSLVQLFVGWVLLLVAAAVPAGFIKKD